MRAWVYGALFACLGCARDEGPTYDPVVAPPDPDFKWVGAFSSYTAIEITAPVNQPKTGVVFSPAAVGSDGSFITYEFSPTNLLVEGPWPLSYVLADAQNPAELGTPTSMSFAGSGYVVTIDNDLFTTESNYNLATTSVATFVKDFEFTSDETAPIATAIAFDGRQAYVFESERNGEDEFWTSKALTGSADDIPALASQLADAGFVITAFGQLDAVPTYGLIGVGPFPWLYTLDAVVAGPGSAIDMFAAGYVPVGGYVSDGATYFIFER
ncbi:MAG TPA: hypothetical protein VGL61_36190 [Kofleriaceae bacterium]|jgi:hypothetical protein